MHERIRSVLKRLEDQSHLEKSRVVDVPPEDRMLAITPDTGQFYNILLRAIKAKKVLEIGTSVGYSALWFADAILDHGGEIITIEQNPAKIKRALTNFQEAEISSNIEIKEGFAIELLRDLSDLIKSNSKEQFDFAFLDADKENLIAYFDLILPMVKKGGIIAADNMLYPEQYRPDMNNYSNYIKTKSNVLTVTLPIGNGQEFTIKTTN